MRLSSRTIAVLVAALVAGAVGVFLYVAPGLDFRQLWLALGLTAGGCFLLMYFSYEALLFREINNIYSELEHVKRKEFRKMSNKFLFRPDPLKRMKDEILYTAIQRQKELDELKRLQTLRSEFLADVSHELKTPIFAAQGFVHTLLDGAVDDVRYRDRFLLRAANALDNLSELVEDLVSISQLEKGVVKMDKRNFEVVALVRDLFEQLEAKAAAGHVTLALDPLPAGPVWVFADRARIRQVLLNLIDNAVKYARPDGGHVRVSLHEAKRQLVQLTVADDGPGIAKAHQQRIFERFYRVDKSRSRSDAAGGVTGSGLGLAISKHIVEAHKSVIHVRSDVGQGTAMSFRLPRAKPGHGTTPPAETLLPLVPEPAGELPAVGAPTYPDAPPAAPAPWLRPLPDEAARPEGPDPVPE